MKPVLLFTLVVLFAFLAGHFHFVTADDGTYLALARSLHLGTYRAINVPGAPPQTQYPPLLPLILFPVANYPPGSLGVVRLWMALWSLLAVLAVSRAARWRDPEVGLFAVLPVVSSALFGEYGTSIMTEPLFVALAYAVVTRTQTLLDGSGRARPDWLLPFGCLFALLLRASAVALIASTLIVLLWHRRWRQILLVGIVVIVGMSPWWFWQQFHQSDYLRSHVLMRDIYDPLSGTITPRELLWGRIPHNAFRYAGRIVVDVLLPPFFRSIAPWTPLFGVKMLASILLTLGCLAGFWRHVRRTRVSAETVYVAATVAMLLVYPVFSDRYLFVLLPSLVGYLLLLFRDPRWRRRFAVAWSAVLLAGSIMAIQTLPGREEIAYLQAVEWVGENAPPGIVVLARRPVQVWYYTGHRSTGYPTDTTVENWPTGDYFVIRDDFTIGINSAEKYADPVVRDTAYFLRCFTAPAHDKVAVYRRMPSP